MNKLALTLTVALVAVAVNAAQTKWTLNNVYGPDGTAKVTDTYTAYMFTTAFAAYDSWASIKGSAAFEAAAEKGYNMGYKSEGNFGNNTLLPQHDTLEIGLQGGQTYDFYALVVNSDYTKYYLTDTLSGIWVSGSASDDLTVGFGSQGDATQGHTDAWKTVESVPEPFSGTLALLGMGVVALRRKMKKQKKA